MRIHRFYMVAILALAAACNSETGKLVDRDSTVNNDTVVRSTPTDKRDTTIGGCYTQIFKRDTVSLQIDVTGNNVVGPLTIKIYEKDMNDGSIKAELADSVIMGWYLYRSEGVMSVRQVAWRVKPGQLWPAIGDVVQRNDSTLFANPRQLRFDNTRPLLKVLCTL